MHASLSRIAVALLLGAGVLMTTWVSAPASPVAPPLHVAAGDVAHVEALAPLAAELDQDVEQLRARLSTVPTPPAPARDPFRFGDRRHTTREDAEVSSSPPAPVTPVVEEMAVSWPALVAVLADADGPPAFTAVVAWGDSIEMLTTGASFHDFTVVSVSNSAAVLRHAPTGSTRTLTLR